MATKKSIENQYKACYMASEYLEANGHPGANNLIAEEYGHELHTWDAWHNEGAKYGEEAPDYSPTLKDLNEILKGYGIRVVAGRNMRIEKI